jgi:putative phage-type endonuclease
MLTPWQLKKHNESITASKIAAIIGISPWSTPFSLYQEMAGEISSDMQETERMKLGSYMEPVLHAYCEKEFGWKLVEVPEVGKEHPEHPFLWCLPDRLKLTYGPEYVVEFKNVDSMFRREWDDEGPPEYYKSQVHFQSMIYNLPGVIVACFGGNEIKYWEIERDQEIEGFLLFEALKFWKRLQDKQPPDTDGHAATSEALKRLFPRSSGTLLEGPPELKELAIAIKRDLSTQMSNLQDEKDALANRLKVAIGENDGLIWSDGTKVTWKKDKDRLEFDEETFKLEHPDIYEQYQKTRTGSRRFLISLGKGNK